MQLVIVIATYGWVFVGRRDPEAAGLRLVEASCVRRWGTTKGLGQLALSGQQKGTTLDYVGEVHLPTPSVVAWLVCDESKWK